MALTFLLWYLSLNALEVVGIAVLLGGSGGIAGAVGAVGSVTLILVAQVFNVFLATLAMFGTWRSEAAAQRAELALRENVVAGRVCANCKWKKRRWLSSYCSRSDEDLPSRNTCLEYLG